MALLRLGDVTMQTGITRYHLLEYIKEGKLKAQKIGKQWYVSMENVEAFQKSLDQGG